MARRNAPVPRRTAAERVAARRRFGDTRRRQRQQAAQVVQLPRLGQDTTPDTTPAPVGVARWLWRHRWNLTPAAAASGVIAATASAAPTTAMVLTAVAAAAHQTAARGPEKIAGRTWLSRKERGTVASWSAGSAVWAAGAGFGLWNVNLPGVAALGILTGLQTADWIKSRAGSGESAGSDLSGQAAALVAAWPHTIGLTGPAKLQGSRILPDTVMESATGALVFDVELRDDVHGEEAVDGSVRRRLERALHLGIGTVELATNRDNSAVVRVTVTPDRHLEKTPAQWPGPVLHDDGTVPLADERSGQPVNVALYNDAGVEHAAVFGTTGSGKSNTLVSLVLPGVAAGAETLWFIDGGGGTSAGHLTGAADWIALDIPEWTQVIAAAHAVMRARKGRRAALGLSSWRGRDEDDPVLTVLIDEATTVRSEMPRRTADLAAEILREGRKLGVRLIQSTQDPAGDGLLGGRQARGLMAGGGSLIAHRAGDGTANVLASGSTSEQIDLRALPPEPGWVAVIRRGTVLTRAARVRYATPETVEKVLVGVTPRCLSGADAEAAGDVYRGRVTGAAAAARMRGDMPTSEAPAGAQAAPTPAPATPPPPSAAAHSPTTASLGVFPTNAVNTLAATVDQHSRVVVLNVIRQHPHGISPADLRQITGLSKTTANRWVVALAAEGLIDRDTTTGITRPVPPAAA